MAADTKTPATAKAADNLPANVIQAEGMLIPVLANQYDDKAFNEVATGGKFLPRLQLFGGNSDLAKEGKIQMGTYGLATGKDQITPLGPEVDVLVIAWRPKALDMSGEDIVACYNPTSTLFKDIEQRSEGQDSGCMFGPEFLVYIPKAKQYATFMMGSKSARREAPNVKAFMGKAATLKVTLAANKRYKWHATVVTQCSAEFELPPVPEIMEKATAFNNPEETEKEVVEEKPATQRAR